jgi:hypothetical protein
MATAAACVHGQLWLACPRASVGLLHGNAPDVREPHDHGSTGYIGLGAQVGFELPLSHAWSGRVVGHLDTPLLTTSLEIDGTAAWKSPRVSGGVGAALLGDFF